MRDLKINDVFTPISIKEYWTGDFLRAYERFLFHSDEKSLEILFDLIKQDYKQINGGIND